MVAPDSSSVNPRQLAALALAKYLPQLFGMRLHSTRFEPSLGRVICLCHRGLNCDKPGKHPVEAEGRSYRLTAEQVETWVDSHIHCNIGYDLATSGILDIAPDSVEWEARFIASGLPETFTYTSANGKHYVYMLPADWPHTRRCISGQYDIMSAGLSVAPGSLHKQNVIYAVLNDVAPVAAPPWAREYLEQQASEDSEDDATWERAEQEPPFPLSGKAEAYWYGREWVQTPEGKPDRSETLWAIECALAAVIRNPRIIAQAAKEWADRFGANKFASRGEEREHRAWVREALRAIKHVPYDEPIRVEFTDDTAAEEGSGSFYTMAALAKRQPPSLLVQGFLPEVGVAVFYGDDGTFKTFMALHLAGSLATGRDFMHRKLKQGPVYYFAGEAPENLIGPAQGWIYAYGAANPPVYFLKETIRPNISSKEWLDSFTSYAKDKTKPRMLVFDTCSASAETDESDNSEVAKVIRALNDVAIALGCLVLVVHHTGKDADKGPRGASVFRRNTDAVYLFENVKDKEREGLITCIKPKGFPRPPKMGFTLKQVKLGAEDEFGEDLTTLVIVEPENPEEQGKTAQEHVESKDLIIAMLRRLALQVEGGKVLMTVLLKNLRESGMRIDNPRLSKTLTKLQKAGYVGSDSSRQGRVVWPLSFASEDAPFGQPTGGENGSDAN